MRAWLPLLALTLSACEPDKAGTFNCDEVAMRDDAGDPDPCDVDACQACVDECGAECAILESFPVQYACPDASFTVTDFCPDWTPGTATEN